MCVECITLPLTWHLHSFCNWQESHIYLIHHHYKSLSPFNMMSLLIHKWLVYTDNNHSISSGLTSLLNQHSWDVIRPTCNSIVSLHVKKFQSFKFLTIIFSLASVVVCFDLTFHLSCNAEHSSDFLINILLKSAISILL